MEWIQITRPGAGRGEGPGDGASRVGRPSLLLTAVPPAGSDEDTKAHTSDQPEVTQRGRGLGGVACVLGLGPV